jgi:hypothetical protein
MSKLQAASLLAAAEASFGAESGSKLPHSKESRARLPAVSYFPGVLRYLL